MFGATFEGIDFLNASGSSENIFGSNPWGIEKYFVGDRNGILILHYSVWRSRKAVLLCEAITQKLFFVIDLSEITDCYVATIHFAVGEQMFLSVMNATAFHLLTATQI